MGALLCCFRVQEAPEQRESPVRRRICPPLNSFVQPFRNGYISLFQSGDVHVVPLPAGRASPSAFTSRDADYSAIDSFHPPPRPLAFDDPRFSAHHDDVSLSQRDKFSSQSHEDTQSLRGCCNEPCSETGREVKTDGSKCGVKLYCSDLPQKRSPEKKISGSAYYFCPTEDEDVCPTCLEEYTPENPKITLQCSHDYHLSCIYEWMERSEACPVCGKIMMFVET
ncbi:E3 ubiquitin-protein ligase At3g02290-like [Dioscorea cayenensis subsp. rotundata]|uniref:RING-type E3 ubiquitin transferase n=1 Tax=Dioscorea cayennensis subsp. rotundata TaxID=55577 RepID=A0AB40C5V6_DIOCR|nr:E3 ubiquitin-protein ligase At3g02290-like [Dioscorea cayenensis subsp. rotundata]